MAKLIDNEGVRTLVEKSVARAVKEERRRVLGVLKDRKKAAADLANKVEGRMLKREHRILTTLVKMGTGTSLIHCNRGVRDNSSLAPISNEVIRCLKETIRS